MKISHSAAAALALGLAFCFSKASVAASEAAGTVNLGGVWKLNKELSDDPGVKMMEAMRNGGGERGGPGGGGGMPGGGGSGRRGGAGGGSRPGGPGGANGGGIGMMGSEPPLDGTPDDNRPQGSGAGGQGQGGRRPQGPPPGAGGNATNDQNQRRPGRGMGPIPSPELTIEQENDNLAFRTENNLRLLHSDGQKRMKEGDFGKQDVIARFIKGALVIETKAERGGKRKETYTLREDKKLEIDFDIEGSSPMPGLKFKLVYDAAAPPLI